MHIVVEMMAAVNNLPNNKPPESSYSDTGQNVLDRTKQKIITSEFPSCQRQTIKETLQNMPMEDYIVLLEGCTDKSKVKPKSEQAEIISQLEHQMKVQPEVEIPTLTNSKYSSSLQNLLQNKERGGGGKTSHHHHNKVATAGISNIRPGDHSPLYQQSPNTFNSTTTTSSCPVSCSTAISQQEDDDVNSDIDTSNNLPSQYYFNCAQDMYGQSPSNPNPIMNLRTFDNNKESLNFISVVKPSNATVFEPHEELADIRRTNKSNNIQLINEPYVNVANVTNEVTTKRQASDNLYDLTEASYSNDTSFAKSPPLELNRMCTSGSSPNSNTALPAATSTLSPISQTQISNYQNQVFSTPTLSQNPSPPSSTVSRHSGTDITTGKKTGKKGNRNKGLRETNIKPETIPGWKGNEGIDDLVQFVDGAQSGKRGNKKKERESRGKGNEPLVKSVSLDDDNLSLAAVKKTVDRNDRSSSLKDATGIQRSDRGRVELDKKERGSSGGLKDSLSAGVKKSLANQGNRRESDPEDNRSPLRKTAETNFTVVIRKRRNKTACSTSEPGSGAERDVDKRQELRRSGSRGERRKSVGSVPASDQSEGSDDGSVRSLPTGKCTQRENVPMSCASSGGTPQTSYADIARLTKDEEAKREFPQALDDYPLLHGGGSEHSEGSSDDGSSVRSLPLEENVNKLNSSAGTSYADIARVASHVEKIKDEKKDRPTEDFPELLTTTVGATTNQDSVVDVEPVTCPSPKSDYLTGSASKSGRNETASQTAFPKLTTSSASKNSLTQGPSFNQKTISSGVVSTGSVVIAPKVTTNNCTVSSNHVVTITTNPTQPNTKTTTGATSQNFAGTPPVTPLTKNPATPSTTGSTVNVVPIAGKKSASSFTPANVLNSPTLNSNSASSVTATVTNSGGAKLQQHSSGAHSGKNKNQDLTTINLNGHLSDSEKDRAIKRSDNIGAKSGKSAFSVTVPQPIVVDQGDGQCTEAVVFCGENFKEPPQLPSQDLQFEFGFDVNEALMGMSKRVKLTQQHSQIVPDAGALPSDSRNNKDLEDQCTPVPDHVEQTTATMDYRTPTSIRGVVMPTMILEYPVNFAQYFLPPDSILYINTNVNELGNIMERRAQDFQRLAREDPIRCRRVT